MDKMHAFSVFSSKWWWCMTSILFLLFYYSSSGAIRSSSPLYCLPHQRSLLIISLVIKTELFSRHCSNGRTNFDLPPTSCHETGMDGFSVITLHTHIHDSRRTDSSLNNVKLRIVLWQHMT